MRQRKSPFLFFLMLMISCTSQYEESAVQDEKIGEVSICLSVEEQLITKTEMSEDIFVPELNEIKVEIFKNPGPSQVRLYRELYGNISAEPTSEDKIVLNCGNYRMLASYGDSLAMGVNKPYYAGIFDFTLDS